MPLPLLALGVIGAIGVAAAASSSRSSSSNAQAIIDARREERRNRKDAKKESVKQAFKNAEIQIRSFSEKHGLQDVQEYVDSFACAGHDASGAALMLAFPGMTYVDEKPLFEIPTPINEDLLQQICEYYAQNNSRIREEDERIQSVDACKAELNRALQMLNGLGQNGASRG